MRNNRVLRAAKIMALAGILIPVSALAANTDSKPIHPKIGEKLAYRGYWFGIPVGEGYIEVAERDHEGKAAIQITAHGKSTELISTFYPIEDRMDILLEPNSLFPILFEKNQSEGDYRAHERVSFDLSAGEAHYESLLNGSTKQFSVEPPFYELVSSLYWFRNLDMQPGNAYETRLYTDEKVYDTRIDIKRKECLELLKRGSFPAIVVEPEAKFKGLLVKRGRIWAYFSDDRYRIPLLIKATTPWGTMSAVIKEESIPEDINTQCGS